MKYVVILADGMADWPCPELEGKTPMSVAHKPHMNAMAAGEFAAFARRCRRSFCRARTWLIYLF